MHPISRDSHPVRFGTIHLMLPVDPNRPVPTEPGHDPVPRDDWAMIHANALAIAFRRAASDGFFKPMIKVPAQIQVPGLTPLTHPHVSPRGDQTFHNDDITDAVKTYYDSTENALRVRIDEPRLPHATLVQVLGFFMQAMHSVTGRLMHYGVSDTPHKGVYEGMIDQLDTAVARHNNRPRGNRYPYPDSLN